MTPSNSSSAKPLAVVTGASRGIGAEFVRQLLEKGYEVVAVTRNAERLKEAGKNPDALEVQEIDLESKEGPKELAKSLDGRPVSLLVNNAGMLTRGESSFTELNFDDLRRSFEVNTLMAGRVCQALLPNLKKASSGDAHAKVAQVTSLMGSIADNESGGYYAYRVSKAALNMLNKSFSIDHPFLTSIVLHPGWVKTDMGGSQAPTLPTASVKGMLKIIENAKAEDSGRFFDFEGGELPW